jgi:hypothetical protein
MDSFSTYLVRKSQGELDFVGSDISVAPSRQRRAEGGRLDAQGGTGDTKGVHGGDEWNGDAIEGE